MGSYKSAKEFLNNSYDTGNVARGILYWQKFLLAKCQNLFIYENLPESLPAWEIEKSLIMKGTGCVVKKKGKLWVPFSGSVFGFDEYNIPNRFTYAQAILGSGSVTDGIDGAIIWNSEVDKLDPNISTLYETICRYSRMLADIESTMQSYLVAQRAGRIGVAQNSQTARAVDEVMTKLEMGECKTIVNSTQLLDTFRPISFAPTGSLSEFSRTRDYLLNCFYNEIGLQTLETKRERMITSELEVDGDVLENNISSMYKARLKNVMNINKVFGNMLEAPIKVYMNEILGGK